MRVAKPYKQLHDRIHSDSARSARVAAIQQAMEDAVALSQIRERRQLTQKDIASVLEMSQANISRIEHQRDLYLSTLASYIEALGGTLKLTAVFEDDEVEIAVGDLLTAH